MPLSGIGKEKEEERARNLLASLGGGAQGAPGTSTSGEQPPQPGDLQTVKVPGSNILVTRQFEAILDSFGRPTGEGKWVDLDTRPDTTASDQLSNQIALGGLEIDWARLGISQQQAATSSMLAGESVRSNKAREAEARRQRALSASSAAVQAYLTGTQLADARRLNAFQEARELLPSLVDPSRKFFAGQEPGGTLATAAERFGLPFEGAEVIQKTFRPGELAKTPTKGQVGSEIVRGVEEIRAAGK